MLDYLCRGKGVIPIEKIQSYEDLDSVPEGEFYKMTEFYSSLRNKIIKPYEYENVRKFWQKMTMKKLLDFNDIYNFQGTIILCEIFENRANQMMNRFPYNPGNCSSASLLSGCFHRFISKMIIALPTKAEIDELFEQTLIGGFSCVNTRLSFDSKFCSRRMNKINLIKNLNSFIELKTS